MRTSFSVSAPITFGSGRDDKRKQQEDDLKLFNDLVAKGFPEDAAQYIVQKRSSTGVLDTALPNYQNDLQPGSQSNRPVPLSPVSGIPERSTLKDFNPMANDSVATYDAQNPNAGLNLLPVPRGTNIKSIIPTNKPQKTTGKDPVAVMLAKKELADLQKDIDDGIPIDPSRLESAKTAAALVGNVNVVQEPDTTTTDEPGAVEKFFGKKPVTTVVPGKTSIKYGNGGSTPEAGTDYASSDEVVAAYRAGKLDRATAKSILQKKFKHK